MDDVTHRLSDRYRCIAPTWPFGAQRKPVGPNVDLGVEAAGRRILGLLEALDLSDVTLVANDTAAESCKPRWATTRWTSLVWPG
ncbi:alpha/beta hydrolase fold domain protein [Mycobacterium xenopi 4042]|uniref:Alpha/beta hydrolase fold domain protein n=1 Tax=Mycobacterium xenopi 4042 TaxID=1299334 RepID=X8DDW3_MYCXE|nr:alpha/beta hydrolase fold domain protein [Mycobacterium xenopi 4042]